MEKILTPTSFRLCAVLALCCSLAFYPREVAAQSAKTIFAGVAGQVLDLSGNPVPGATVLLDGPEHLKTTADTGGHFTFASVSPGTYTIAVHASGFTALTLRNISVTNEDLNLAISLSRQATLREIGHVVASAGRGAINITAAPSYNLTPADMAFQGQIHWRNILEEAPGLSVSAFKGGAQQSVSGSPANDAVVSIRGSLPYETAMLIDNMPMYGGGINVSGGQGVNLASYDPQTFGAFDVVTGPGAQSPSIVDAIGGTLNLHPAGQVTQNRYNFSLSNDPYGGVAANGLGAMRLGRLSVTATYGFSNSPGPYTTSRIFGGGISNWPINTVDGKPFTCNGACHAVQTYPSGANAGGLGSGLTTGLVGCCLYFPSNWTQHSGSLSLAYQLSRAATAQFFFAGDSHPSWLGNAVMPALFSPTGGYSGSLPAGESFATPYFANVFLINSMSQIYEGKLTFQLGRGQLQLAALNNRNDTFVSQELPTGPIAMRLFGGGSFFTNPGASTATTPVVFNGGTHVVTFQQLNSWTDTAVNNRDLSANYATPLGDRARAALSYVHSYYDNPVSGLETVQLQGQDGSLTPLSFPSIPEWNFESTDEFRLGLGITPSDRTSLDVAYYIADARYHVLNPNDRTQNTYIDQRFHHAAPRAGFVWRPSHNWAVRASAGGGYALAPVSYLVGSTGTPRCGGGTCTQTLPNVNLQPETSWGFDAGFDARFSGSTILSFDAYQTILRGQLYDDTTLSGTFTGLPLLTTQYRNVAQARYAGLALDLHRDVPRGTVWSLSAGLMRAYLVSVPAGFYNNGAATCNASTLVSRFLTCANLNVLPNINFNGTFLETNVPYAQGFAMYGYRWSPDSFVNVQAHYFGNNNGYYQPAFVAFDANAQVPLTRNVALQATIHNVAGIYDNATLNYGHGSVYSTAGGPSTYVAGIPYGPRALLFTLRIHR